MHIKLGLGFRRLYKRLLVSGKRKVFCIGLNKTGTTSLHKEMIELGYVVGGQQQAELLFDDWVKRDFKRIIRYCNTAEFFQDIPFSLPYTFIAMDQAFPGSKFILTLRDSAEQWYKSLIRFHSKIWADGRIPPTPEDLKNATYIYKSYPYHTSMHIYNVPEDDPYNKDILLEHYHTHRKNVLDYFRHRTDDLLVINVKENADYTQFCEFFGVVQEKSGFPWENKT